MEKQHRQGEISDDEREDELDWIEDKLKNTLRELDVHRTEVGLDSGHINDIRDDGYSSGASSPSNTWNQ